MNKLLTLVLLLISFDALSSVSGVVIAHNSGSVSVNSYIDVDAEYVAMSVSLSSEAKYPNQRLEEISQLQSTISQAATSNENISFIQGAVSLSPRERSSFSLSKSYGGNSGSSLYILSKLDTTKDVYSATQETYSFIAKIQKPKDTNLNLGNTRLAINSPNQYRDRLLEKLKEEITNIKNVLGEGYKVSISGLENSVIVTQKNDKQVTILLDYQIELSE